MRRFVFTLSLLWTGVTPAAAQHARAPAVPPTSSGTPVFSPRMVMPRRSAVAVQPDGEALVRRRRRFASVGGVVGGIAGGIWAVRSVHDDGLARALSVLVLPIPIFGGAALGAVAGYGLSFVVYPPRRAG